MSKRQKLIILIMNCLLPMLGIVCTAVFLHDWGALIPIASYVFGGIVIIASIIMFVLPIVPLKHKDAVNNSNNDAKAKLSKVCEQWLKSLLVIYVSTLFFLSIIIIMNEIGGLSSLSNAQKMQKIVEMIRSLGVWGYIVFVLFQIIQVLVLPLPAPVCFIPGALVFGPLTATILASIGVIIGSFIAFLIGRLFGRRVVTWMVGEEKTSKYSRLIGKKGKVLFVLMQLLPFFPDDIICMVAGLTSMSPLFFGSVIILVRPIMIALTCYLGTGDIIPFSGWGIPVWVAIIAVCIILIVMSWKYQERLESFIANRFGKKSKCESALRKIQERKVEIKQCDINCHTESWKEKRFRKRNRTSTKI